MYQMLNKKTPEVYVLGRRIAMSANKARRVIDQIRGRSYEETLIILELMPYRASYQILKLVYSAASNASYTMAANKANLVISKAEVNEGTARKKLKPRARGRSYPIKRPTCHITIVLKDISFNDSESVELSLLKKSQAKKNSRTKAYSDIQNRRYLWDKK